MTSFKILPLLPLLVLLAACNDEHFDMGPVRSETREVKDFNAIDMEGDGRIQIVIGSPASLTIEGRELVVQRTTTEVRDGTLYIKNHRRDWIMASGSRRLALHITVPSLASLKLDGGNDVRVTGFNGGSARVDLKGAANLKADGVLDSLTVAMAGAGHADFSKVVANDAKVTVDGVGAVYVNSTASLDATMNGVGAILYSGNPRSVNTAMNGLGKIAQRDAEDREKRENRDWRQREFKRDPQVDPDSLQPEYEDDAPSDPDKMPAGGITEVI